jgi:hypothetical protein
MNDTERRIRLLYEGNEIFHLMAKTVGKGRNEMIVKSAEKGSRSHYGLAGTPDGLAPHVKHERRKGKPIYDLQPTISIVDILRILGPLIAPENDPPPKIPPELGAEDLAEFSQWLERVLPKVMHAPTSRKVHIPTESGIELIEECRKLERRMRSHPDKQEIDISSIAARLQGQGSEGKSTVVIREDEMSATGHSVALSEDESKMILLLDDSRVVEFSTKVIEDASGELLRRLGLLDFFDLVEKERDGRKFV